MDGAKNCSRSTSVAAIATTRSGGSCDPSPNPANLALARGRNDSRAHSATGRNRHSAENGVSSTEAKNRFQQLARAFRASSPKGFVTDTSGAVLCRTPLIGCAGLSSALTEGCSPVSLPRDGGSDMDRD